MFVTDRRRLMGAAGLMAALQAMPALGKSSPTSASTGIVPLLDLLPPPPADGSAQTKVELDEIVALMRTVDGARKELAIADNEETVAAFLAGMGLKAGKDETPLAEALFQRLAGTVFEIIGPAKSGFGRPRPPLLDGRITPLIRLPASGAYPSGHTANGTAMGIVLAKMLPEKRAALFARVKDYALSRMIAGVHYRSDLEAGFTAGTLAAYAEMQSAEFQGEFGAGKAELRRALGM